MKTLEMADATGPLSRYTRQAAREPLVILRRGRPAFAMVSIRGADLEDLALTTNADFIRLIERSRARYRTAGGFSLAEMRRKHAPKGRAPRPRKKGR
jgi:hypothetical protein